MPAKLKAFFFLLFLLAPFLAESEGPEPFRFHLVNEPGSFNSWEQKNSASGYLLSQISGTLLQYQNHQLQGRLAEGCRLTKPTIILCQLRKNLQWSDGKPLTASDFVRAFQELIDPTHHAFRADLIFPVQNAREIFASKKNKSELKVKALRADQLEIQLTQADPEFLYTLTSPLLAPLPEGKSPSIEELRTNPSLWKSSGPYVLSQWQAQKKIVLKNNDRYWKQGPRPEIEIRVISEDSVALNLYEKGELSFLRRLPTLFIPKYKGRPDYFEIEQIRFDYLGFSQKWKNTPDFRLSLAQALRYSDLQNLFHAKGQPGCPGLPESTHKEHICHEFQLQKAKSLWASLKEKPAKVELLYSRQGGDDHKRSMEWIQSEWKTHLGLNVDVTGLENQIFLERLEKNPPDLFRKGLAPDRPTCLSVLENFETGNGENYIHFSNSEFDQILKKMRFSQDESQKQKLCDRALHLLMDLAWIIPTGPIHFTILVSPRWTGWQLNELNQLDLTDLRGKDKSK